MLADPPKEEKIAALELRRRQRLAGMLLGFASLLLAGLSLLGGAWGGAGLRLGFAALSVISLVAGGLLAPDSIVVAALLVSAFTGGPRSPDLLASAPLSIHGVLTAALLLAGLSALGLRIARLCLRWLAALAPFIAFACWAWLRVPGAPSVLAGLSDALIISAPLTIGLLVRAVGHSHSDGADRIERMLLYASAITVVLLLLGFALGHTRLTPLGFSHPLGTRTLALYLMVILALALGWWRFHEASRERRRAGRWALIIVLILVVSLSRAVVAIAVGILVPVAILKPRRPPSWIAAALLGLTLVGLVFMLPPYRVRFGEVEQPGIQDGEAGASMGYVTSGRSYLWPIVMEEAMESPWVGRGTGSSRVLVQAVSSLEHPHGDYLRVFHDLGAVGLALFAAAWLHRIYLHLRRWRALSDAVGPAARLNFAAFLAASAIALSFVTDNTLVYAFVMMPAMVLFALADEAAERVIPAG